MRLLYFISVFFHILSATVWIGGMLFLVLVLVPLVRNPNYQELAGKLVHEVGVRFRFWGWVCLCLFLVTGYFNLSYRFQSFLAPFEKETWLGFWGEALATKLILFALVVTLSAIHDFYIGPKATRAMQADPESRETLRLRRMAGLIGRLNLLLAFAIVILGTILVRGLPW